MLSDSDDGGFEGVQLTINEHYAKAFEYKKEREELEKLKAKYGSDFEGSDVGSDISSDSESDESEDEHGEELTPAVDVAILRTLARIRKKDPAIYQSDKNIFGEEREKVSDPKVSAHKKSKDKSKSITLRQVAIDAVLHGSRSPSPEPLPHVQEQAALRDETIAAFHTAIPDVDDEEDDGLLIPREKTKDEQQREEEEYRAFLEREVGDLRELVSVNGDDDDEGEGVDVKEEDVRVGDPEDGELKKKKKKKKKKAVEPEKKKSKAENDQEFLMSYILNRGWIDRSEGYVPTYGEVTSSKNAKGKAKAEYPEVKGEENSDADDLGNLSDSSFDSLASHFETSYNHRFEEPGAAVIPGFPRSLPSLVRRQDTTRKDARERKKQRKEEEIQKRKEEVRRLKALKMREIRRKLDMISKEGGLAEMKREGRDEDGEGGDIDEALLQELDLEGEWDPEKHDRQMEGLFGGDYVPDTEGEEGEDWGEDVQVDEAGKPLWTDDIDIGDIPISDAEDTFVVGSSKEKKKKKKKKKKKGEEEEQEEEGVDIDRMDADVERLDDEEWDGTEEMRKKKAQEYMDEVYGLDFNDMVGGMPTRFKYVPVQSQNYSLTPVEILLATDQELNEYMSVKKYAPYRQEKERKWDSKRQDKLKELKSKLGERVGKKLGSAASMTGERGEGKPKKRKGKKERMKMKVAGGDNEDDDTGGNIDMQEVEKAPVAAEKGGEDVEKESKKRKRKAEEDVEDTADREKSVQDEDADGSTKKKRRRHKKKNEEEKVAA